MALVLLDRVQQAGTANTTVSFTLSGSVSGFQPLSAVGDGNTTYYSATDNSGNWEVGIGTYTTAGTLLTRTTILSSSNSGSAVTFSGSVSVFVTYPSSKSVNLDASGNASALGTPAAFVGTNITGTASGLSIGGSAATLTTGRTIAITGDLAYTSPSFNGSVNVTAAGTLATVNANVGAFTNASLTVNAKGLVTAASSGTAPVTSVTGTSPVASSGGATPAISLAASYGDTQNPYASKTANFFLAAPNGSAGVPTFRAAVAADIPTLNQNTSGSSASCTGNAATATTAANLTTSGPIYRSAAGAGYLNGQYSGVETTATSGAIYSIGGSYLPGTTTLGNMYGIGYGYSGNAGITATGAPSSLWGMYVASGGVSRIFLSADAGNAYFNGSLYAGANITAYSDERVKTNWRPLSDNFVANLAQVKSGIYDRTDMELTQVGIGAQSLQKIMPNAITKDEKGMLSIAYGQAAMASCVELAKVIEELRAEIKELKKK